MKSLHLTYSFQSVIFVILIKFTKLSVKLVIEVRRKFEQLALSFGHENKMSKTNIYVNLQQLS